MEGINQNPVQQLYHFHNVIDNSCEMQKSLRRDLRSNHKERVKDAHEKLAENNQTQAFLHWSGLISALVETAGITGSQKAFFDLLSTGMGFANKLYESEMTQFKGILEELRDRLSEETKREDEISRLKGELSRMVDAIEERLNRTKSTVFHPG